MEEGTIASDFTLPDQDGKWWTLSEEKGKTVVLLFYPGDNTPVCQKQLCSVRDHWLEYASTGATVIGISTDSIASHKKLREQKYLPLRLLSDALGQVTKMYGVESWIPGHSSRAVIVIDPVGEIRYRKVEMVSAFRPNDRDILKAIRSASSSE